MTIEHLPPSSLSPDPANARRHGQRNLDAIVASLRRFGQQKPIVVDAENVVRAGNGTLAAAKALGWATVAVVRSDLAGADLAAYAVADNRSAELAEWDAEVLAATLADPLLGDVGFTADEIAALAADAMPAMPDDIDVGGVDPLPPERWLVVVTCDGEQHQAAVLDRLAADGLSCRAVLG